MQSQNPSDLVIGSVGLIISVCNLEDAVSTPVHESSSVKERSIGIPFQVPINPSPFIYHTNLAQEGTVKIISSTKTLEKSRDIYLLKGRLLDLSNLSFQEAESRVIPVLKKSLQRRIKSGLARGWWVTSRCTFSMIHHSLTKNAQNENPSLPFYSRASQIKQQRSMIRGGTRKMRNLKIRKRIEEKLVTKGTI